MKKITATARLEDYPFDIRPLSHDEGGGYLISYPDFNVCISDGETVQEAITNGKEALSGMIEALQACGHPVPAPGSGGVASGKFVTRIPKSLHAALTARAKMEGVSLNSMVLTLIAQGIGRVKQQAAT
jgi:antitoxin HicB